MLKYKFLKFIGRFIYNKDRRFLNCKETTTVIEFSNNEKVKSKSESIIYSYRKDSLNCIIISKFIMFYICCGQVIDIF